MISLNKMLLSVTLTWTLICLSVANARNSTKSAQNQLYTKKALKRFERKFGREDVRAFLDKPEDSYQKQKLKNRFVEALALEYVAGNDITDELSTILPFDMNLDSDSLIQARSGFPGGNTGGINSVFYLLEEIWGYGCWCYFGEDYGSGRGSPVNEMDADCQALGLCYQCIEMDLKEEGKDNCFPGMEQYNRPVRRDSSLEGALIACAEENEGDNCKIYTCTCETTFVNKLIRNFFNGIQFDPTPKHSLGFNPSVECPGSGGNHEKQCCGTYPSRTPYGINTRACCEPAGKTYNPSLYECCDDGSLKISC